MRRRLPLLAILGFAAPACFAVGPPSQKVAEVARDTNVASRFGSLEPLLDHTAEEVRDSVIQRRAEWGNSVRVLDLELAGLKMPDSENATVLLDFQWMRLDEDLLHQTRVEQTWRGISEGKGWELVRERRLSGDFGLFGERIARAEPKSPREDVQFPSKTIR
jgi:hypothetical protein